MESTELRFKNGIIGLFVENNRTWPSPFAGRGYLVNALEKAITTELDGSPSEVKPEFIISSSDEQHIVLWEIKHGSFKIPQARKLRSITISELLVQGVASSGIRQDASKDVIFVCPEENIETLHGRLKNAGFSFVELLISQESIKLFDGKPSNDYFSKEFTGGVTISGYEWPSHFVPFDHDSSDADISPHVLGSLVHCLIEKTACTLNEICRASDPFWAIRGNTNQNELKKKIDRIVTEAVNEELSLYISRPTQQPQFHRVPSKPWNAQTLDTISDHVLSFNQRKQIGIGYKAGQLRLFAYDWGLPKK